MWFDLSPRMWFDLSPRMWFDLSPRMWFDLSHRRVLEAVREARELGYRLCVWFDLCLGGLISVWAMSHTQ